VKPLIILNPNSQGGKTGANAGELERVIARYLGAVEMAHTERSRHAVEIAERAANDGRETIIAVGGDGTIHEVTNGLMRARANGATDCKLGIVGQGTGGDFRKSLELEHRLDKYCQVIADGNTKAIDMAKFRYRNNAGEDDEAYFVNILSVGIGGLADRYVAEESRALGGTFAYFKSSVRALIKSEIGVLDCTLTLDGESQEIELHTRQLAICNGRFFGSGMEVAPMAQVDDGILEVVSLGDATRMRFMMESLSIYSGSHIGKPGVETFRCERIDIALRNDSIRDDFPLDVDGEPLGTLPLSVEVVPAAIDVFVDA